MCIIIDANVASAVFSEAPHPDLLPILNWLMNENGNGNGGIVYGGQLAVELNRVQDAKQMLAQLYRAGRAFFFPDKAVDAEEGRLVVRQVCRSDDPHVVALARISGARVVCTHDHNLQRDFRDPNLISNPRGSVYQRPQHIHLLKHTNSCPRTKRNR